MKEATGELNMTVITVVAIAAVAAFFYAFVWPQIKKNIEANTYCASATCSTCTDSGTKKVCSCSALKADGTTWTGNCSFEK